MSGPTAYEIPTLWLLAVSVHTDAKIGEVLIPLAYSGVHRVWVMDEKKTPVGVVSMSDVIDRVCKSANL